MTEQVIGQWMGAATEAPPGLVKEQAIARDLAGTIDLGVLTIPSLLTQLAPFLGPDENLTVVARALALLPSVLDFMETEPGRHEIHAVTDYLCTRLENRNHIPSFHAGIREIATSLKYIVGWNRFVPGDAERIMRLIFAFNNANHFAKQTNPTRLAIFELVELVLKKHLTTLIRDMRVGTLVNGMVALSDLEKNPSCLRILFTFFAHASRTWPLSTSEYQSIWDSFIRYYPITIRSPPQDPTVPSSEELRSLLLECFLSNDVYAKEGFATLIAKLDVSADLSANVKKEVLTTLDSCSKSYSVATISQFSSPVWEALKFEVWNGDNEEFIQGSLDVLQTVTSSLSRSAYDVTDNTSHLAKFVIQVANECGQRFHDNKHVYMVPTGRILRAVASGSPYAFYLVARSVLPALHTIWQDLTLPSEKKLLLTVFNDIVRARLAQVDIAPNPETDSPESTQKMQEYMKQSIRQMVDGFAGFRDRLLEAYFNDTTLLKTNTGPSGDVSFGIPAIQGLVLLFKIPSFLSPAEKGMVVEELNAISSNYTLDKEIHGEVILALEQISTTEPKMFKEIILVYMMEKLPQQVSLEPGKHEIELQSILACLQDLVQISCTSTCRKELDDGPSVGASTSFLHRNFDLMQIGLLKKFDEVFRHEGQLDYVIAILAAIFAGLERFDSVLAKAYAKAAAQEADSKVHPYDHIVFSLFQLIVEPKQHVADAYAERGWAYTGVAKLSDKNGKDDKFIQLVGRIAMSALRSSVTTAQNNFLLKWNESNIEEPSAIWTLFSKNPAHETLAVSQPHLEIGPAEKCLANVLSVYLLAGSRRDDKNKLRIDVGNAACAMIQNAISVDNKGSRVARVSMLWFLQLLVNKFGAAKESSVVPMMQELVDNVASKSDEEVNNTYQTLAYFATAALACFDPSQTVLVKLMLSGISEPNHGLKVAKSFRLLLAPSEILNKENFCIIRPLRKQRLYDLVVPQIMSKWVTNQDKKSKDNCLIALAGVLDYMEPALLNDNAREILPLCTEGTNVQNDEWAKFVFISTLLTLVQICSSMVEEHLDSVINRMTDRTHNTLDSPSDSSVRCRAMALEVLGSLTMHIRPALLLRRKFKLMAELDVALDDCSREVRQKAERCKMLWFNLADSELEE